MSKKIAAKIAAAAVAGSMFVAATSATAEPLVSGITVKGSGSSFAYNGISKCNSLYDANNVSYDSTGSGTGRTNYRTNSATYGFAVSDGLYTAGTEPAGGYTMAALFGGPVVFAYGNKVPKGLRLDASVVSGILKGTITTWDAAPIKALNKQFKSSNWRSLKGKAIKVYYRNVNSGTNENLSNYLLQTLGSGWTKNQSLATASGGLATGALGKGTSALVADSVESDGYGFGYFDLSDAKTANVRIASLKNKHGQYIAPSASAGQLFLNAQTLGTGGGDRTDGTLGDTGIDFTKDVRNAYQLTIVTYGVAPKGSSSDAAAAVEDYFKFIINTCMPAQASRLGYIALTGSLKTNALNQIAGISTK